MSSDATNLDHGDTYVLPASLAQERFWALDRLSPGNPAWNLAVRFALRGPLDPAILERSLQGIVQRHEVLRTNLATVDGRVSQIIAPSMAVTLSMEDLRHLPEAQRADTVDRRCLEAAHQHFDLAAGPLLRARLLQAGDCDYVMTLTIHHSIADYWSIGVIAKELAEFYTAYSHRLEPHLAPLTIQYGDYAIWQHNHLQDAQVKNDLSYWRTQLTQLPVATFPTDRPRSERPTYNSAIVSTLLPMELSDSLGHIANQEGATFFQITAAALAILVFHYTRQTSFGVSTQVAGRDSLDLEPLVGLFINTVILRFDVSGDPSFCELLRRVQKTATESLVNQNLRFEQLLAEVQPQVYPSHHGLCPLNFICERDAVIPLEFSGITLTTIPSKSQGAPYELNIFLVMRTEGWRLSCEYNTDLFEPSTIGGLLDNYRGTLERVAGNPDQRISELQLALVPAKSETATDLPATRTSAILDGLLAPNRGTSDSLDASSCGTALNASDGTESPASDSYALPITINQQRFWLFEQLMPGNPMLNMPAVLRVSGTLDPTVLRRCLTDLVKRHEMLRTTFSVLNDEPMQVIHPPYDASLEVVDLRIASETERESRAQELIREEAVRPFNLAQGPIFRAGLIQLEEREHILMLTMPHIVCDGWTSGIVVRELTTLYDAYSQGLASPLSDSVLQYADFSHWQSEWLKNADFEPYLSYWKKQLQGRLPLLDLPGDRPLRPALVSRGATETVHIAGASVVAVKDFCKREEITTFMLFLAIFKLMLKRYTGQEDILVGSPVSGRTDDAESIVGSFAYPISLRTSLHGNPSFSELVHRIREVTLEALAHKDLPFRYLVDELQVEQIQGRNPLFQFYFFHQVAFLQTIQTQECRWTPITWHCSGTEFDLHLATFERDGEIVARLEYKPDLFDASTARRMLGHFQQIIDCVLCDPEQRINQIPILTTDESEMISRAGLGAATAKHEPALSRIESFARQKSEAVAIISGNETLTYGQLDHRASQLASRLVKVDLAPSRTIAICSDYLPDLVIGMLAAGKAGAAFMLLPADDSKNAGVGALNEHGIKAVITCRRWRKLFRRRGLQVVCVDETHVNAECAALRTSSKEDGARTAIIQLVSSTSSDSKLAQVSQRAFDVRAWTGVETYGLRAEDRIALINSTPAVELVFSSLIAGATIVFVPSTVLESDARYRQFVEGHRCSVLILPTRFWQRMILRGGKERRDFPQCVQKIVLYGDRPSKLAVAAFQRVARGQIRLLVSYGGVEVSHHAAIFEARSEGRVEDQALTLGVPSPGFAIRLLDENMQPVPAGVPAMICIAGPELASGYLGDEKSTAASFRFSKALNGTWFRTGELGRYLSDGKIDVLGPSSRHVNIGGFRTHVGELEAALMLEPSLSEVLAVPCGRASECQQVEVYAVVDARIAFSKPLSELEVRLKKRVAESFPDGPQVSQFRFVDSLPIDVDGHVSRSALATEDAIDSERTHLPKAHRDSLEAELIEIWEEVLGVRQIRVTDNFFHLGGHSLLAMRLFSRINQRWGTKLPLSTLLDTPSIQGLAEILRQDGWRPPSSSLVAIRHSGSLPPLYIISGLGGNVIRFNDLTRYLHPDRPLFALQPPGLDGSQPYLTRLEDMAAHYIREIKTKQPSGPYYLAGYSFGGLVTFEMGRQLIQQGDTIGLLALLDSPEWHYHWQSLKSMDARAKIGSLPVADRHGAARPGAMAVCAHGREEAGH